MRLKIPTATPCRFPQIHIKMVAPRGLKTEETLLKHTLSTTFFQKNLKSEQQKWAMTYVKETEIQAETLPEDNTILLTNESITPYQN